MIFSDSKFGILFYPPSFQCGWASVVEAAVAVEKCGFDSFWTYDSYSDPMTILSAVVSNTKKLKIGTCLYDPLSMYPARSAGALSNLDHISSGRLIVGTGAFSASRFSAERLQRVPPDMYDKPVSRMLDTIEIMKKVWTENNVTYNGKFYKLEMRVGASFKSFQKPHPPIWINASGPRMLRMTETVGSWELLQMDYLDIGFMTVGLVKKNGRNVTGRV